MKIFTHFFVQEQVEENSKKFVYDLLRQFPFLYEF